jgi:hypothetical protein
MTKCIGQDPLCPCADGLWCHYVDGPVTKTKGWLIPTQTEA